MGSSSNQPGKGIFGFMVLLKIVLGLEGLITFVIAAIYTAGLIDYNDNTMPYTIGGQQIPYNPIPDTNTSDESFYYAHATRSQIALGALTFLHALIATVVACCCLKANLKRQGIIWTIAGLANAITAIVAVGLTFSGNNSSGQEFPNAPINTMDYWSYGHYTAESWVCGTGKRLVNYSIATNGNNPLGGSGAVNDFDTYCKEARASKWLSVIILITSVIMMFVGVIAFFKGRKYSKTSRSGQTSAPYNPTPAYNPSAPSGGYAYGSTGSGEEGLEKKPNRPTAAY